MNDMGRYGEERWEKSRIKERVWGKYKCGLDTGKIWGVTQVWSRYRISVRQIGYRAVVE